MKFKGKYRGLKIKIKDSILLSFLCILPFYGLTQSAIQVARDSYNYFKDRADSALLRGEFEKAIIYADSAKNVARIAKLSSLNQEADKLFLFTTSRWTQALQNALFSAEAKTDSIQLLLVDVNYQRQLATRQRLLSLAQSLVAKSEFENDAILKALLVKQAIKFHKLAGGYAYDRGLYRGLYLALKTLKGLDDTQAFLGLPDENHRSTVQDLSFSPHGQQLYSVSSDGLGLGRDFDVNKLFQVDTITDTIFTAPSVFHAILPWNGGLVASADDDPFIYFSQADPYPKPNVTGSKRIWKLDTYQNEQAFYYGSQDGQLIQYTPSQEITIIDDTNGLVDFDLHTNGKLLAYINKEHQISIYDAVNNRPQQHKLNSHIQKGFSLAFHPTQPWLALGNLHGDIYIWDLQQDALLFTSKGHTSAIDKIAFDAEGRFMATGGYDGKINIWQLNPDATDNLLEHKDKLPILLDDNEVGNYVSALAFHPSGNYLLVGYRDGRIRSYPTDIQKMEQEVCRLLNNQSKRELTLTENEWEKYVSREEPVLAYEAFLQEDFSKINREIEIYKDKKIANKNEFFDHVNEFLNKINEIEAEGKRPIQANTSLCD